MTETYEEWIELVNKLDTAHYITYVYGCLFIICILLTVYCGLCIAFGLIVKKKRTKYLEKLTPEERTKCLEYNKISIFTKIK